MDKFMGILWYIFVLAIVVTVAGWRYNMGPVIWMRRSRGRARALEDDASRRELEEAAAIDGCGIWKILFKVYMPLMKPTMVTIFILSFLSVWNDFVLARVLLLSNDLQTISMASALFKGLYSTDYAMMTAAIVILVIPQLAVFAGLQKHIIDGITAGAVKG